MKIDINKGLSSSEVNKRINEGLVNIDETPKTKSIKEIIKDNFFNYFNFLNIMLGAAIIIASIFNHDILRGFKNCLFMGVIIVNSVISIIEEIISKKIIDKLSIIGERKSLVIRDGNEIEINVNELVKDDIIKISLGHQIAADTKILDGSLEVNESFITGESDAVSKTVGDTILSGSFIISGNAIGQIINVGKDNYVSKISMEAKYKKEANSIVMGSFTNVLKMLSILIIPIGIIMFIKEIYVSGNASESAFTTVASLIGMIPEGLILLSSSVMAVGIIKLYRVNVLVQQLYSIETLARVDAICLDKTGTLTEGKMKFNKLIPTSKITIDELDKYVKEFTLASTDTNATMKCLKEYYQGDSIEYNEFIPFSSDRKYSAIEFNNYSLYLGAPDILFKKVDKNINEYLEEYRVLAIGKKNDKLSKNLNDIDLLGYILVEDVIRPSAKDTINYFKNNNVLVKIISGDDVKTTLSIAKKVGLNDVDGINISSLSKEEVKEVLFNYDVFGRVKPEQKKWIINILKENGHTVAMTGDGVNDVLALKESDCAISIKSGTDAARNVAQLVLLNDDFNSLPRVVEEGRQIINNIERSASLLLVKTLYTIMLIIFSILSLQKYFFIPIQLTFITTFTIGAPSFFLALEPNKTLVKGNFLLKIFAKALPISFTVLFNIVLVSIFSNLFNLSYELQSSISVILTTIIGLMYLYKISVPFTWYRATLFIVMLVGFIYSLLFIPDFFNILSLNNVIVLIVFVLALDSLYIYKWLNFIITFIFNKFDKSIEVESKIQSI